MDKRVPSVLAFPKSELAVSLMRIWIDCRNKWGMYWVFIKSGSVECCAKPLIPSSLLSTIFAASDKWFISPSLVWLVSSIVSAANRVLLYRVFLYCLCSYWVITYPEAKIYKTNYYCIFYLDGIKSVKKTLRINIYTEARHCHNSKSRDQGTWERYAKGSKAETNGNGLLLSYDETW